MCCFEILFAWARAQGVVHVLQDLVVWYDLAQHGFGFHESA